MVKVRLYDTTLRDGAQGSGVSFSLEDKLKIAQKLDDMGIHYIEGGYPGSNPKDINFFREVKKINFKLSKIAAFTSTRKAGTKASQDTILKRALQTDTPVITVFGKSWKLHVKDVLKTTSKENLQMIEDSVVYFKSKNKEVIYDAEHFFDGYKDDKEYALKTLKAAVSGGADCLVLCDTNGGTLPFEIDSIIGEVKKVVNTPLGIHAHNDAGTAVANSLAAVRKGITHIQGTINGLGERCGNADLLGIIPNLQLKMGISCLKGEKLGQLTQLSLYVNELANLVPQNNQPFVGSSAFAHKGGMHVDAVKKNPLSFEHIKPEIVGNRREIVASELSGKSTIIFKAKEFGLALSKDSEAVALLLDKLKNLENQGYHFEAADASLELLMKRIIGGHKKFFTMEGFSIYVGERKNRLFSEATIQVKVAGEQEHTAAEGDGPVDALANALKKALLRFYPTLAEMELIDYKVRIVNPEAGTAAKTRVLIQFHDHKRYWSTIGVSVNILEASWQALTDSIEYKLLKDEEEGR